jgi:hypothetical protein
MRFPFPCASDYQFAFVIGAASGTYFPDFIGEIYLSRET